MQTLDRLIPSARLVERDTLDVLADVARAWEVARSIDLGSLPIVRALFAPRASPTRVLSAVRDDPAPSSSAQSGDLRVHALRSTPARPGFQVLAAGDHEIAVGAIGQLWRLDIPFVHVADAASFATYAAPDEVKVAWAIRVESRGPHGARVTVEVRVDATDEPAWRKFRAYYAAIGPAARLIRHALLRALARELGSRDTADHDGRLLGDEQLPDAQGQITHGITIHAPADAIWPWLVQMGCHRPGHCDDDLVDDAHAPTAREIHPDLQNIVVGDVLPAAPGSSDELEVLVVERSRGLVLGGLYDTDLGVHLAFGAPRPRHFWQVTWAFELEPIDARTTRLHVRARATTTRGERLRLSSMRPIHRFMDHAQLVHLAHRAEGSLPRATARDVVAGVLGAGRIMGAALTPFLRGRRSQWGVDEARAAGTYPGDDLVATPRWSWTHGIVIEASASEVWPWIAQIGAGRAGFYSFQWLENLVGCDLRNAESVHPEWTAREGDVLYLHPKMDPMRIVHLEPERYLVAFGGPSCAPPDGAPWGRVSWLLLAEEASARTTRVISRFRVDFSKDVASRVAFGASLLEPLGTVMDRGMLHGVKKRVERARREVLVTATA